MKRLNVVVGAGFAFIGLINLLLGDGLLATVMGLFSASIFLSDLHYAPAGVSANLLAPLAPVRKALSIGLAVVALGLFGYQIGSSFGIGGAHAGLPVRPPHWSMQTETRTGFGGFGIRVETRYFTSPG